MLAAGLNAVRINMSHGTGDEHAATIAHAREAAASMGLPLAILVDLAGPKIPTLFFVLAVLVSLGKSGMLLRWVEARWGEQRWLRPVAEPSPAAGESSALLVDLPPDTTNESDRSS